MGNPASVIDFDVPRATFLAQTVNGGTWADVFSVAKFDGTARGATEQKKYPARIWSNAVDDFVKTAYLVFEGTTRVPKLAAGVLEARPYVAGDQTPFLRLIGNGTNSAETEVLVGSRDPSAAGISALPGTLYVRISGANSDVWVNRSAGPGAGTTWVASFAGIPAHGSTHAVGGSDPISFAADARVWGRAAGAGPGPAQELTGDQIGAILDAATEFVRRDGTTPLTAPWDAGAFTITMDGLVVNGAAPRITLGDYTAAGFLDLLKPAASEMVIAWHSNDAGPATRWEDALVSDESRRFRAYTDASVFLAETVIDNATHQWTYPANAVYSSASPLVQIGAATGSPSLRLQAAAATANWIRHSQGGATVWDGGQTHNDANWYLDRFVGGAFQDSTVVSNAAHQWVYPGSSQWNSASPQITFGSGTGGPGHNVLKAEASEFSFGIYSAGFARWAPMYVPADETLRGVRYDAAGVFVSYPWVFANPTQTTTLNDTTISLAAASVLESLGDDTGSPTLRGRKVEAGSWTIEGHSAGVLRSTILLASDETLQMSHRDGAGSPNATVVMQDATWYASSDVTTVNLRAPSVVFNVGTDGTGSPTSQYMKADAGFWTMDWYSAAVRRWLAWYFNSDETLRALRYDAAGVNVNTPLVFGSETTVAATSTTFGDASTFWSYVDPYLQVGGTTTALWTLDFHKDEAGQGGIGFYNEAQRRFFLGITTGENTQMQHQSAAGALLSLLQFQAGADSLLFMYTPSPTIESGDGTGGVAWLSNKAAASSFTDDVLVSGTTRYRFLVDPSEDVYAQKYTAAPALETEWALLGGGFFRIQTHWGVTDATTLPSATAGYAKFAMDTAANGRPKLVEGDGAVEQLGVGIDSQAMPMVDRETTDLSVANTTTETDIVSKSIPANAMGATGYVRAEIGGHIHHEGTATLRLRIYLGSTTLYDSTTAILIASSDDDAAFRIVVEVVNQGATNDQAGCGYVLISHTANPTTGLAGDLAQALPNQVDVPITLADTAVDTTSAQTFRVSVTWSAAAATNALHRKYAAVRLAAAA